MIIAERDVIIVGAGPAGSICAAYLAKAGVDVLLLEKDIFPRDKACGDMECEGIVSHMGALGAVEELDALSTCIRNLKLISNRGNETLIPFECYCAPRYELDRILSETAVKHGAELRQSCTVTGLITENGTVTGVRAKYKGEDVTLKSRIVMIADGAFSSLGKSLGIAHEKPYSMWIGERAYFKNVNLDRSLAKDQYNAYGVFGFSELTGPGYFWVMPVGRDGVRDGVCNVGVMVNDLDAYRQADLQERFYKWSGSIPKIGEMFERAVRISPWEGGRMNDISQGVQKAGDGYMVIGDAAALTMPRVHDGLSAAADSAKAAALAALGAFMAGDVAGENLMNEYMRAYKMKSERVTTEQLKLKRLLMESMHDPSVMDKTIELLETDPIYRKSHLKR